MITPVRWHPDDTVLRAFSDAGIGPVLAASTEEHLLRCAHCRSRLAATLPSADRVELDGVWARVRSAVEVPAPSRFGGLLRRLGLSAETRQLLAAVSALRRAYLLGTALCLVFTATAATYANVFSVSLFLLIAPLAPVVGVAISYGGDLDPAHELVVVSPYGALRLLLLRSAAVIATSVPPAVLAGLLLPAPDWVAVAWLTPAAAGIAVALALTPVFGTTAATGLVCGAWSAPVLAALHARDPLVVLAAPAQALLIAITVVAALVVAARVHTLDLLGRHA